MTSLILALVLTAPPRWVQQPPRTPVVRVQKPRPTRKRVRRVVHRKPPTVYITPDVVKVMTMEEVERERKAREMVRWVTWF